MTNGEKVRRLAQKSKIKLAVLAREMDMSPANMSNKIRRNKFSQDELIKIATLCEGQYKSFFIDKNGNEI